MTEAEQKYWAEFYITHVARTGIPYSVFLHATHEFADMARDLLNVEDFEPLLPAQRHVFFRCMVAEELITDKEIEALLPVDCVQRGGRFIEPLHHHAHRSNSDRVDMRRKLGA